MTIELRVTPRIQTSPMSCWWACMAMTLEYYGQNYLYPWHFKAEFERPWNQPMLPWRRDFHYPSINDAIQHDSSLQRTQELAFMEPYEWYEHGLPRNRRAFEALAAITGFRGFDRPSFGSWTRDDVESRLREYGPYMFLGFWSGVPHAILVVGLVENEAGIQVVSIDPVRGFATGESLERFNHRMGSPEMREFTFNRLNPLYKPQSTSEGSPIRGVVSQ